MDNPNDYIFIKYRIIRDFCSCCNRKLDKNEVSELRELPFRKREIIEAESWKEIAEFGDELEEIVEEYVHETIRFNAVSSIDRLRVEHQEYKKVSNFIMETVNETK